MMLGEKEKAREEEEDDFWGGPSTKNFHITVPGSQVES